MECACFKFGIIGAILTITAETGYTRSGSIFNIVLFLLEFIGISVASASLTVYVFRIYQKKNQSTTVMIYDVFICVFAIFITLAIIVFSSKNLGKSLKTFQSKPSSWFSKDNHVLSNTHSTYRRKNIQNSGGNLTTMAVVFWSLNAISWLVNFVFLLYKLRQ